MILRNLSKIPLFTRNYTKHIQCVCFQNIQDLMRFIQVSRLSKMPQDVNEFIKIITSSSSVLDPQKNIFHNYAPPGLSQISNIDRQYFFQKIHMKNYKNSISCFPVDIGPIFKMFKNLLNGSSSFVGPRFVQENHVRFT